VSSFGKGTINIGDRKRYCPQADCVIDCAPDLTVNAAAITQICSLWGVTRVLIRPLAVTSVSKLVNDIHANISNPNKDPPLFTWTSPPDK